MIFRSLRQLHRDMKIDHMVFCVEGKSWRYNVWSGYKAKRRLARLEKSEREKEDDAVFMSVLEDLITFLREKTRCTVLQKDGVEGDDFVARWIQLHPDDEHVILSGDSDFIQLLSPNVTLVDGVQRLIIKTTGVSTLEGEPCVFHVKPKDGKIKVEGTIKDIEKKHLVEQKAQTKAHEAELKTLKAEFQKAEKVRSAGANYIPSEFVPPKPFVVTPFAFEVEPEWWKKALFIKIVRGDMGDSIGAAYPGVRYEGSKNKTGIKEAWEDRNQGGFNWNNFMLQRWEKVTGHDSETGNPIIKEVRVMDEYRFNESLIDLTCQPQDIIDLANEAIVEAVQKEPVSGVGIHFMRFCGKNELANLSKEATDHSAYLNAPYVKV